MGRFIDLSGQRFGSLIAIGRSGTARDGNALWLCKCDCGNVSIVDGSSLRKGNTKTCGCSRKRPRPGRIKHNDVGTRLYRIWGNMKHRCYGKNDKDKYRHYGGRGISVCAEWHDYRNFKEWAIKSGYKDTLTLDRIDNDGNYCPENCRWETIKNQSMNRRSNHMITENNETLSVTQWANKLNVSHSTIINRKRKGVSVYGNKNTLEAIK